MAGGVTVLGVIALLQSRLPAPPIHVWLPSSTSRSSPMARWRSSAGATWATSTSCAALRPRRLRPATHRRARAGAEPESRPELEQPARLRARCQTRAIPTLSCGDACTRCCGRCSCPSASFVEGIKAAGARGQPPSPRIRTDGPPRMEARPTGSGRERSSPNRCDQCRGQARQPSTLNAVSARPPAGRGFPARSCVSLPVACPSAWTVRGPADNVFVERLSPTNGNQNAFRNPQSPTGQPLVRANPLISLVGTAGFELATPCTPCKCATRLRYAPFDDRIIG